MAKVFDLVNPRYVSSILTVLSSILTVQGSAEPRSSRLKTSPIGNIGTVTQRRCWRRANVHTRRHCELTKRQASNQLPLNEDIDITRTCTEV